jgi:hypothetical protein
MNGPFFEFLRNYDYLARAPSVIAWGLALVLAILMVKRKGGRAEKLFLAGSALIFSYQVISPAVTRLWGLSAAAGNLSASSYGWIMSIPGIILGISGFIVLVLAFWFRFWVKTGTAITNTGGTPDV